MTEIVQKYNIVLMMDSAMVRFHLNLVKITSRLCFLYKRGTPDQNIFQIQPLRLTVNGMIGRLVVAQNRVEVVQGPTLEQ